ncbi:MAG: DUF1492 domain-containing protein [Caldilineaceae bacterium]
MKASIYRKTFEEYKGNIQQATNRVLRQALKRLAQENDEYANVLQSRYIDNEKVESAAGRMNFSEATFHRKRNEALPILAETVIRMEREEQSRYRNQMEVRLAPSSYANYFGRADGIKNLISLLQAETAPWIVTVVGIGGIGKTSMADAVARRLIEWPTFREVGWVTAKAKAINNARGHILSIDQPSLTLAGLVEKLCGQLLMGYATSAQRSQEESLAVGAAAQVRLI